jgi:dTDP-4-amino-4,6-dideoxy-D-galactose acyltransferase
MKAVQCQFLEWDTAFFGFRIAKLTAPVRTHPEMSDVLHWCKAKRIRCLYYLAPSNEARVPLLAAEHAFSLVDIRVTLERVLDTAPAPSALIRGFTEEDLPALAAIAKSAHTDSRFYFDPGFPRERCDALYQRWIEKSARDSASGVLVAEWHGQPAGYITCDCDARNGQIGLVAVAEWARGAGLGTALVASALNFFKESSVERVSVITQGRNTPAQRLYQRHGFLTRSVELWFHRWFSTE